MSNKNSSFLSDQLFELWKKLIYDQTGIYYQDNKKVLLETRLLKRINKLGLENYDEYFYYLKKNKNELRTFLDAITIKETYFFRNSSQIEAIINLIANLYESGKREIKIWSAACSSGEEAYTIAIAISEILKPKYPYFKFEIIGTDINHKLIDKARKAYYNKYSLRNTPEGFINKYFVKEGRTYNLKEEISKIVEFDVINLCNDKDYKKLNNFDIIICANVLMYFDLNSKIKVVSNLYKSLNKNGYLFLGRSESIPELSKKFKMISFSKAYGYQKI